jgi:hypothetical protein
MLHVRGKVMRWPREGQRERSGVSVAALALVVLAACDPDVVLFTPEVRTDGMVIVVTAEDQGLAERMGWSAGVPGATVSVRRDGEPDAIRVQTDADGRVTLSMPAARYWIWVERHLDSGEQEAAADGTRALGGGIFARLQRNDELNVPLSADDPGSLVISEYHYHYPPVSLTGLPQYGAHMYLELHNNADTTVYLDGKILGSGFNYNLDAELWPCSETAPYRNEPQGVYAQYLHRFPGSGIDYPVPPGGTVLIADQAIDHSAVYPGLPDLRSADFEVAYENRANNPNVPDLVDIGPKPIMVNRSAMRFSSLSDVAFVAHPLDLAALTRIENLQGEFVLVPNEAIMDLASFVSQYYLVPRSRPLCFTLVDRSLDHVSGVLPPSSNTPDSHLLAVHRKQLPGSEQLQRTRATHVDFVVAPRSPGTVP